MNWISALRISLLGSVLLLTHTAFADATLDATIENHVMPRFEQEAREFMWDSGAQFVSSRWDGHSRTLIAVGELPPPRARPLDVAYPVTGATPHVPLESEHVARLCRHPAATMLAGFMATHDITMTFVYERPNSPSPLRVIDIDHADLAGCL